MRLKWYVALVCVGSVVTSALLAEISFKGPMHLQWLGFLLVAIVPVSSTVVSVVNWLGSAFHRPVAFGRAGSSEDSDETCAIGAATYTAPPSGLFDRETAIIICPVLLTPALDIEALVRRAEANFNANADAIAAYCILSDFDVAPAEELPTDAALMATLNGAVSRLNAASGTFMVAHRPRERLPGSNLWGPVERKRGKIDEFNKLLCDQPSIIRLVIGERSLLRSVRYVFTTDADTTMEAGQLDDLCSIMAQPGMTAVHDEDTGRVISGYGMLQPRPVQVIPISGATRYQSLYCDDPAPAPREVTPNTFQDLFGEGSFYGKGLYDVHAYRRAMDGRIPANILLSHDLIEGCFVRCASVMDSVIREECPATVQSDMRRKHRWIRGDWQSLPWAMPWVRRNDGRLYRTALSGLSRWKVLDNIRRASCLILNPLLLLFIWCASDRPALTTVMCFLFLSSPALVSLVSTFSQTTGLVIAQRKSLYARIRRDIVREALRYIFMLREFCVAGSATLTAWWRMLTRSPLSLEWQPSGEQSGAASMQFRFDAARLSYLVLAAVSLVPGIVRGGETLAVSSPFVVAWCLAPVCSLWLDKPAAAA